MYYSELSYNKHRKYSTDPYRFCVSIPIIATNNLVKHILANKNDIDFPAGSFDWLISQRLFAGNAIGQSLPNTYEFLHCVHRNASRKGQDSALFVRNCSKLKKGNLLFLASFCCSQRLL